MSLTYAIADLHGRFDLLTAAYDAISAHSQGRPLTIVHLGDYIDRGPESRQVIECLMDDAALPPWVRRVCLRGNHEDIMVETIMEKLSPDWWIGNGGGTTLISYGHDRAGSYDLSVLPAEHLAWAAGLPRLHVDQHRLFVHAGVKQGVPLDQQDDETTGWMRYPKGSEDGHGDRHVVHGHHPHVDGPVLLKGRTNLDTLAWYTGRLVIGVFNDDIPGGPVDLIEVQGELSPLEADRS